MIQIGRASIEYSCSMLNYNPKHWRAIREKCCENVIVSMMHQNTMKPNIHIQVIVYENDKRRPFSQGYQCNYLNLEIEGLLNTSTGPINVTSKNNSQFIFIHNISIIA